MCEARQYSDQMSCGRCGLAWDVNDPEPPACQKKIDRRAIPERRVTRAAVRQDLNFAFVSGSAKPIAATDKDRRFIACVSTTVPVELSDTIGVNMAEIYERHRAAGFGGIEAMKAAYRFFLDQLP